MEGLVHLQRTFNALNEGQKDCNTEKEEPSYPKIVPLRWISSIGPCLSPSAGLGFVKSLLQNDKTVSPKSVKVVRTIPREDA